MQLTKAHISCKNLTMWHFASSNNRNFAQVTRKPNSMANEVSVAPFLMTGASGNQLDEVVWFGARVTRPRSWPEVWLGLKVLVWTCCLSDLVLVADLVVSSGAIRKGFGSLFGFCSARVNASCCVAVFAIGSTGASVTTQSFLDLAVTIWGKLLLFRTLAVLASLKPKILKITTRFST